MLIALLLCRLLVPTEAPEQGHTLWIATLWFGFAACRFALLWRNRETLSMKLTFADAGLALLVLGHLVSGLMIIWGTGNQRSAVNMMWEWLSLGTLWILFRMEFSRLENRKHIISAILITVTGLSLFGIWQHYYWYPQQAVRVQRLVKYAEQIEQGKRLTNTQQRDLQELTYEYGTDVITLDASGRMSYVARVQDSVEPIGRFALANSFAMPLVVALLLLFDALISTFRHIDRRRRLVLAGAAIVIFYCLILTKSRTAWVAGLGGGMSLVLGNVFRKRKWTALLHWAVPVVIGAVGVLCLVAIATGGLDREVILEAPKSLQYRLEYWSATVDMLRDHPVWGSGLGNFRQMYLHYKLPGSSEEILDPHNLFLGVWAGGGLISLAGLLVLLGCTLASSSDDSTVVQKRKEETANSPQLAALLVPQIVALTMTIGVLITIQGSVDPTLTGVAALCLLMPFYFWLGPSLQFSSRGISAALLACVIHLLGASGIEMPAIVSLVLLLAAMLVVEGESRFQYRRSVSVRGLAGLMGLMTLLLISAVVTRVRSGPSFTD